MVNWFSEYGDKVVMVTFGVGMGALMGAIGLWPLALAWGVFLGVTITLD